MGFGGVGAYVMPFLRAATAVRGPPHCANRGVFRAISVSSTRLDRDSVPYPTDTQSVVAIRNWNARH